MTTEPEQLLPLYRLLRYTSLAEGVSTLALWFVAMPAKYLFDSPQLIPPVGMAHGLLYVLLFAVAFYVFLRTPYKLVEFAVLMFVAIFPGGAFIYDRFYSEKYLKFDK